jgi:hypothetical protein
VLLVEEQAGAAAGAEQRASAVSVRNRMLVSLRGGGGELGNLKTITYGFTNFTQRCTRAYYLDVQLGLF